jgi:hypothetical protein
MKSQSLLCAGATLLLSFAISCQHIRTVSPGQCPPVTEGMILDLSSIIDDAVYQDLELWIAEIDRFCTALDSMR